MSEIIIGNDVINRASSQIGGNTVLDINNPCNGDGILFQVDFWPASGMSDCAIGLFRPLGSNQYECVQSFSIGTVLGGALRSYMVEFLNVMIGDVLGMYYNVGSLERTASGSLMTASGNRVTLGNTTTYTPAVGTLSIKGIGVKGTDIGTLTFTINFTENSEYILGVLQEHGDSIINITVDGNVEETPITKNIANGNIINLIARKYWNGCYFSHWNVYASSGLLTITTLELTLTILESLEIRAIYKKHMFRESVESVLGPILPSISATFRQDSEYTII